MAADRSRMKLAKLGGVALAALGAILFAAHEPWGSALLVLGIIVFIVGRVFD